jgi:hypothetical protein
LTVLIFFFISLSPQYLYLFSSLIRKAGLNPGEALVEPVAYPGIFFGGGEGSTNSVEDRGQRERGSGGGSPLVSGSGGSCNLVQEISFHKINVSQILVL